MKEQEVAQPRQISKEEFLNHLDTQKEYWEGIIMNAQMKLLEILRIERKIETLEERNFIVKFYTDGKNCFFEAKAKQPIGFEAERKEE